MKMVNCDIYQLKDIVQDKKLVCFGMGKVFWDFLEDFSYMQFEKNIYAVTDNKIKESGKKLGINKCFIPLICLNQFLSIKDMQNIIVLISCADIGGVYEQLCQYEILKEVKCYAVYFIRNKTNRINEKSRNYPKQFRITENQKIPKIIHYCWFGKTEIPKKNLECIESWKHYCPEYKIIRWDESNYNVKKNNYMYEAYERGKWGFASDYARLDIIYNYGGIYLDTDVEMMKSYDDLLYQSAFCGVEANQKVNLGLGFGAEKKNAMIKKILELYRNIHFIDTQGNNTLVTCVQLQYPFFKKNGFIANGDYQIIDDMTIYPESVLSPKDVYTGAVNITKNTYSIHHFDGSWLTEKRSEEIKKVKELYKQLI